MDTTTNEVLNQVETSESTNELESTNEPMEKNEVHELETTNEPMLKNEVPSEVSEDAETQEGDSGDDFGEIDLSAIEVATEVLDQINSSFKTDESLDNIMNACSSTAQALKQTIVDVLKCRENIVIAAGDSSNELETTLNEKLADFKNVVSGCYIPKDPKTDLTNIKHPAFSNVIITEVNETEDSNLDASSTSPVINEEESKQSSDSCTSDVSELNEDSKPFKQSSDSCTSDVSELNKDSKPVKQSSDSCTSDVSELNADSKPFKQSSDSCISDVSELNQDSKPLSKTQKDSEKDENYSNNKGSSKEVKSTKMPIIQSEAVPVSNSSEDDKNFKKQQKYNSNKKKGEKTSDQILKSLANCSTTEEKLQTLCKRHVETLEEYRLLEPRMKQLERQVSSQQREKEQLQAEHNRMILAKSRLESLCRELQKQNKAVKEESLLRIKEEEERRKEIASKFQATLNDISMLMQENAKKNMQLREENAGLAKKLKALVDHYDMWEKHMEKVVQQNNLEAQLAKAKYAKVNLLLKQETEKFLREKQALLENMSELQKKCTLLTSNELKLRTELGDYTSKYEEFQSVLNKSSQVFASFKTDMEATSKKIKKLEKETNVYKQKWESSNNALLGMINDKQKHDKELANAQQRIITLEKLCRALQAERNELQNQLNIVSGTSSKKDVPSTSAEAQA